MAPLPQRNGPVIRFYTRVTALSQQMCRIVEAEAGRVRLDRGGGSHVGRLEGKVAIITGAGSGIGRQVALEFAGEGALLIVNDRRSDRLGELTVALIAETGGVAVYVDADVSVEGDVARLVRTAVETYGRLDVMVNNAGVARYKPLQELTEEDFDYVVGTNQKGTFFGTKHAVPAMIASGGGSIINTASIAADHGQNGSFVYGATKGAILSMTRIAAAELGKYNIRVNAVQPGVIATGMRAAGGADRERIMARCAKETPLGNRIGTPEDCAPVYVFLASDESRFITGQKLAVDGGILADSHII
jgi:NAD(P)-dependent dehydrogenase (short-subunit alcohol dehydrogenase family)